MKPLGLDQVLWIKPGEGISAAGSIPEDAEFFRDHFPGFPVLPGVLALEMLRMSAEFYFRNTGIEDAVLRIRKLTAVRFAKYLRPGDGWRSELILKSQSASESVWNARLFFQEEVAVSARMVFDLKRTSAKVII